MSNFIFIEKFSLSNIALFLTVRNIELGADIKVPDFLKVLANSLLTLEKTPLKLQALEINRFYGKTDSLLSEIVDKARPEWPFEFKDAFHTAFAGANSWGNLLTLLTGVPHNDFLFTS
mgnify:FL=1